MSFNSLQSTRRFQSLQSKFRGVNLAVTFAEIVTVLIISLYRERFYVRSAKFSSLYREYRCIGNIVISMIVKSGFCPIRIAVTLAGT